MSDVGTNYARLLEPDGVRAPALDSAETHPRTLDVFTRRYVGCTDTKISTSRAAANLQSSIANVAILERQITQQEDAISVLIGANPEPVDRGTPLVDQATPVTPPGLTTDLLRRRPDIRQAEQNMINANAEVGVAVANFFPTVGLSAMYGNAGSKIGNVFKNGASVWNIAANVSGPLFQGGRLIESYRAQQAFWDETIARYRATIVEASGKWRTRWRRRRGSPNSGGRRKRRWSRSRRPCGCRSSGTRRASRITSRCWTPCSCSIRQRTPSHRPSAISSLRS